MSALADAGESHNTKIETGERATTCKFFGASGRAAAKINSNIAEKQVVHNNLLTATSPLNSALCNSNVNNYNHFTILVWDYLGELLPEG